MERIPDRRHAELAKIHIAKKQLGLDEPTYRAMLWTIGRVESSKDLDTHGRQALLDHLKSRGFVDRARPKPNEDRAPLIYKIRAMLRAADRPDAYADGIAKRMFGSARYTWCNPEQLRKLVAALAYDAKRRAKATTE
ncbi:MAG: regulatory protein GemA [Gammaproteobacteria bacterium]|nr:regulatory protein GemA [Gammaproteobacteria bacterium]